MQQNKSKLLIAGLLAANAAKALQLGGEEASQAPTTLAQIQTQSAVQAQLNVAAVSQAQTEVTEKLTELEKKNAALMEKIQHIFDKILTGVGEKRDEVYAWLCDYGDEIIAAAHAEADRIRDMMQDLANSRVSDMSSLQVTLNNTVTTAVADAKAAITQAKADAADAITEKRKDVMYKIKDLKIEIGTSFDKAKKADKKAQIQSLVSELESFINQTIRDYDELVGIQINNVDSATRAAAVALDTEKRSAKQAFADAKAANEPALDGFIQAQKDTLLHEYQAKKADALAVKGYLMNNFTVYLNELISEAFENIDEDTRNDLLATAVLKKGAFIDAVNDLNTGLFNRMMKKKAGIEKHLDSVQGGKELEHAHTEDGRIQVDNEGNPVVTQAYVAGFRRECIAIYDLMWENLQAIEGAQNQANRLANDGIGHFDQESGVWLDEVATVEMGTLAEFLEKGFAFHVDTTDFITHTTHPYAPFSTGDYNSLVDQINGFEQFFDTWFGTKNRTIEYLDNAKRVEKQHTAADVDVDEQAVVEFVDTQIIETNNAVDTAITVGDDDLRRAQELDQIRREEIEDKLTADKSKIFREIGFMAKKLYRATREEYKAQIKEELEETITKFNHTIEKARRDLAEQQAATTNSENQKDVQQKADFIQNWIENQLAEFETYLANNSPVTVATVETYRDDTMANKIAMARAEVGAGLTKKERDVEAAYQAVLLKIIKIDDHHFQYNVRTLLEDSKAEADRRCAHEEVDTKALIDELERWVATWVDETIRSYDAHTDAERQRLRAALQEASNAVDEYFANDRDILARFQEDETHALEFQLQDCVKGLRHLFNRYGYTSPQFEDDSYTHRHFHAEQHGHDNSVQPGAIVETLEKDPENPQTSGTPWAPEVEAPPSSGKSRSSCHGEECGDPTALDHNHPAIQLDSLEDLAHVIEDEIVTELPYGDHANNGHFDDASLAADTDAHAKDLSEKIEATLDFFLGQCPAISQELMGQLRSRRAELESLTANTQQSLLNGLGAAYQTAWAGVNTALAELQSRLRDRQADAESEVRAAVASYLEEVSELREKLTYTVKELYDNLNEGGYDDHNVNKIKDAIHQHKDEFEAALEQTAVDMENLINMQQMSEDSAFDQARVDLEQVIGGWRIKFHQALERDAGAFNDALNTNMAAFNAAVETQRAAFNSALAEKQAAFDAARARKLKQIHFVHDSNYKYHLIKLLEAKAAAITEAIGAARHEFSTALGAEQAEFATFREGQRAAFEAARQALREQFADAEADAEAALEAEIDARRSSFDEALDAQSALLAEKLEAQREKFRSHLANEHAYTGYTYTAHAAPDHHYSPYSHSSHSQFLSQFHYYLSDQLKKLDAQIDGIAEWTQKEVDGSVEAFATAVASWEQQLGDQRTMAQEALATLATSLTTELAEGQDIELAAAREKRSQLEEASAAKAEELKKKIVYIKKQLSYHHGYGHHGEHDLTEAIEALKTEFDEAIAGVREYFQAYVDGEIAEVNGRRDERNAAFAKAVAMVAEKQAELSAELNAAAAAGQAQRNADFQASSQERLDAFVAVVEALKTKVNTWYEEKSAWIAALHDHYYAESLQEKLTAKRDQAIAALDDRSAAATTLIESRRAELAAALQALVDQLAATATAEEAALDASSAQQTAELASDLQAIVDGFTAAVNTENDGLNTFLDELVKKWVWWLKESYGYGGYASHYYNGYDDHYGISHGGYGGHSGHGHGHGQYAPHGYDPYKLSGYDLVVAFLKKDWIGDLPETKNGLVAGVDATASAEEAAMAAAEDGAEATLEATRATLQANLVAAREAIEAAFNQASDDSKADVTAQREAFVADVTAKREAVEAAIEALQNAHYGHHEYGGNNELLYAIHDAKEAFATSVSEARTQFDLVLSSARDANEARLAAARSQFDADLAFKRGELDAAIAAGRGQLADWAAAKGDAVAQAIAAAAEDLEEAIAEKQAAFDAAVAAKRAWVAKVHYDDLRKKLDAKIDERVEQFAESVDGIRSMFEDAAEARRLEAEAAFAAEQADYEGFATAVSQTCDANRAAQNAALEAAIAANRAAFDDALAECAKAIEWAIQEQIKALKEFLHSQYGYQGHKPGPYHGHHQGHGYYDDEYADAVQEYVDEVTGGVAATGAASGAWLRERGAALADAAAAAEDASEAAANARAANDRSEFAAAVDASVAGSAALAAELLAGVVAKREAICATFEDLHHQYYGYHDVHGYRYKLLHQLHHQKEAFGKAVEWAAATWANDAAARTEAAAASAASVRSAFEGFLAGEAAKWEAAVAQWTADLAAQAAAKGEALQAAIDEKTAAFEEKQAYKRHYIAGIHDHYKQAALTKKVDLEDQLFAEAIAAIQAAWAQAVADATAALDAALAAESADLAASQADVSAAFADAIAAALDRLASELGAVGDGLDADMADESEKVMDKLYHHGYGDYQHGYSPVFAHADEDVPDPVEHYHEDSVSHYSSDSESYHSYHSESSESEDYDHYHPEPAYKPDHHHDHYHADPVYDFPTFDYPDHQHDAHGYGNVPSGDFWGQVAEFNPWVEIWQQGDYEERLETEAELMVALEALREALIELDHEIDHLEDCISENDDGIEYNDDGIYENEHGIEDNDDEIADQQDRVEDLQKRCRNCEYRLNEDRDVLVLYCQQFAFASEMVGACADVLTCSGTERAYQWDFSTAYSHDHSDPEFPEDHGHDHYSHLYYH